jgi:hypothetical protein
VQQWVARPDGWDAGGFEFYMAGNADGPDPASLLRAVALSGLRSTIEAQARQVAGVELELGWIDCTTNAPTAAFFDPVDTYTIWEGPLDDNTRLTGLTSRTG